MHVDDWQGPGGYQSCSVLHLGVTGHGGYRYYIVPMTVEQARWARLFRQWERYKRSSVSGDSCFVGRYIVGLSSNELSEALGIKPSSVRKHIELAKKRLREVLTEKSEDTSADEAFLGQN